MRTPCLQPPADGRRTLREDERVTWWGAENLGSSLTISLLQKWPFSAQWECVICDETHFFARRPRGIGCAPATWASCQVRTSQDRDPSVASACRAPHGDLFTGSDFYSTPPSGRVRALSYQPAFDIWTSTE